MKDPIDNATKELPHVEVAGATLAHAIGAALEQAAPAATVAQATIVKEEVPPPATVDDLLVAILQVPRSHDSVNEKLFAKKLQDHLTGLNPGVGVTLHLEGGMSTAVAMPDGTASHTLFSCHIDTVDGGWCKEGAVKQLSYDPAFGHVFLDPNNKIGSCLGADDGAGVWLMLKMIEAKVPGTYLFNRGEERGGISSSALVRSPAGRIWLSKFKAAVAFDRPRNNEIITHQRGGMECASDEYAKALATALNAAEPLFEYAPSKAGVYTDTYEFRRDIPECVNVGVGYTAQHGIQETLDYGHLVALLAAACKVNWDALPIARDPAKPDPVPSWKGNGGYAGYWGTDHDSDAGYSPQRGGKWTAASSVGSTSAKGKAKARVIGRLPAEQIIDQYQTLNDLVEFAFESPEEAAMLLLRSRARIAGLQSEIDTLISVAGRRAKKIATI